MRRTLKLAWLVIWSVALVATLWGTAYESQRDLDLVLTWFMIAFSFPSSLLGIFIAGGISYVWHEVFHLVAYAKSAGIIIPWFIFFSLGWLQWFVVTPWIFRKIQARKNRSL